MRFHHIGTLNDDWIYKCPKCKQYTLNWYYDKQKREHWCCDECGYDRETISDADIKRLEDKIERDKHELEKQRG